MTFKQVVGSDMMIDDYDVDEKQDVAIITPAESPEEPETEPAADDCVYYVLEAGEFRIDKLM